MIWASIILCGIITFLIRFVPLSGIVQRELSPKIQDSLKYIPLAVLTPIIFNGLSILENNQFFIFENYKLYSALIAVIVAIMINNVFATIFIGMLSFLLITNFLNL